METRKAADKKTDGDEIEKASQKEPKKKKKKRGVEGGFRINGEDSHCLVCHFDDGNVKWLRKWREL